MVMRPIGGLATPGDHRHASARVMQIAIDNPARVEDDGVKETEPPDAGDCGCCAIVALSRLVLGLLSNAQFTNDIEISLRVLCPHIVQQPTASADQTQQSTA